MESLKVLEAKIDQMLAQHAEANAERERLNQEVARAQARAEELAEQLRQYDAERAEMKARVERILGRLDGIELG